jgi:hypothetical protein
LYEQVTGDLTWQVDTAGYEVVQTNEAEAATKTAPDADFFRPEKQEAYYARRGVVRAKGGKLRSYKPVADAPGLARRLAGLYDEDPLLNRPTDADVLDFVCDYGLLRAGREMPVRDVIYTSKYLYLFSVAIDSGDKHGARQLFNERVLPKMTVRLVGSKTGRPTANWTLEPRPTNLISAAWLQMAQELTHGKSLKKCAAPDCLEWFPERANKRFCNNRCKMAFHNAQKLQRSD